MESTRQQKVNRLLQRDLGSIFQQESATMFQGAMITVTRVRVTRDLGMARVFVSLFVNKDKETVMEKIQQNSRYIRGKLGARVKNQLRVVPELEFFEDDSLDYLDNIENLLDS